MGTTMNPALARPYAKAVFEWARDANSLDEWTSLLAVMTDITQHSAMVVFLKNPTVTAQQLVECYQCILATIQKKEATQEVLNFLRLLARNTRLTLLPDIEIAYKHYRDENENILDVSVTTATKVTEQQQERLRSVLKKRFQRTIRLSCQHDPSVLGGLIIRAGDRVIDGSIRNQLNTLSRQMTA